MKRNKSQRGKIRFRGIPKGKPHDWFFKIIMGEPDMAKKLILHFTPGYISKEVSLNHLELAPTGHTGSWFDSSFSDVIYKTRLKKGRATHVLFLFKHKSYIPRFPVQMQLLEYMTHLWKQDTRQNKPFSHVVPIIFYHGKQAWMEKDLADFFDELPPTWKHLVLDFQYILVDLNTISEEEILQKSEAGDLRAFLLTLKFAKNLNELSQRLPILTTLSWDDKKIETPSTRVLRQSIVNYIGELVVMNRMSVSN